MRPLNQMEHQMAYQDTWWVCHPDFKRLFASLEDAYERQLPYHVVTDYEAEEDDRTLDSDTTGHEAILELRAEIETREKAGREAHEATLQMAAMVQAEQA